MAAAGAERVPDELTHDLHHILHFAGDPLVFRGWTVILGG